MSAHPILCVQIAKHCPPLTSDHSRAMVRKLTQGCHHGVAVEDPDIRKLGAIPDITATLHRPLGRFSNCKAAVLMEAFDCTTASTMSDSYSAAYRTMPPTNAAITSSCTYASPRVFLDQPGRASQRSICFSFMHASLVGPG